MRGQLAQTGHCVCKYMQLENEHVEAVERYDNARDFAQIG